MSALEAVQAAREQVAEAEKILRDKAKEAIREGLDVIFADPKVSIVAFAQKASEYNDEGMYPGVYGPQVLEDNANVDQLMDDRWENFEDLLGYGSFTAEPRAKLLETALNSVGETVLSDLFGDECLVFVTKGETGYDFQSEYAGV